MNIEPVRAFLDNYIWCISINSAVYCVDPGEAQPVLDYLDKHHFNLKGILITHHHMDHVGGVQKLVRQFPELQVVAPFDSRIPCVTTPVREGDIVCPFGFRVLEIPGHTSTHIAYYHAMEHVLFCGDTLFSAGCGRVFDGTIDQLYQSLMKLAQLPDDTRVYCAHEYTQSNLRFALSVEPDNRVVSRYLETLNRTVHFCSLPSTIGLEKQINPFFRLDATLIVDYVAQKNPGVLDRFEIFKQLREDKNHWK